MARTFAVAVAILVIGGALHTRAQAQDDQQNQAWCAYFTGGPTNCGFATFQQCMDAIKGKTGLCNQNSQVVPQADSSTANSHRSAHRRQSN